MHGAQGGYLAGKVVEVLGKGEGAGQHLTRARVVPSLQRQWSEAAKYLLRPGTWSADFCAYQTRAIDHQIRHHACVWQIHLINLLSYVMRWSQKRSSAIWVVGTDKETLVAQRWC